MNDVGLESFKLARNICFALVAFRLHVHITTVNHHSEARRFVSMHANTNWEQTCFNAL